MKVLLADENEEFRRYLKTIIEEVSDVEVIALAGNGKEAIMLCQAFQPDVVFLDVDLPEMNGIDAAQELTEMQTHITFVFCTAYPEFAMQAFKLYSFDYILKPISEIRVKSTIKRLLEIKMRDRSQFNSTDFRILFETDNRQVLINSNEIFYIENYKPKVIIKTQNQVILARGNLQSLEQRLIPRGFFRCHRGFLVNLMHVKSIIPFANTFQISLNSGDTVFLSRKREKILRDKLKI